MSDPKGAPPAVSPAAAAVLDAKALARLQELDPSGSGGLLTRVLATYVLSLERQLVNLQAARRDADAQGQRHVAHTLKSSSASVGALALSTLCADVEQQLREGQPLGLAEKLDQLTAEAERVLAALRQP